MPPAPLLVLGLSGQLGEALLRLGLPTPACALSRRASSAVATPGVRWQQGALEDDVARGPFEAVLSLGPLDAFARAIEAGRIEAGRIVAFGSTSVHAKAASPSPAERALAGRLAMAEAQLEAICRRRGLPGLVLRPALVWGMGRDATVSRVVQWARRSPCLPLPVAAPGLRQPVHALDLARASLAGLALPTPPAWAALDLPGGETLPFGALLRRAVAAGAPGCRVLPLPWRALRAFGCAHDGLRGMAARLDADLCFDAAPARALLGWAPRGFAPTAADFPRP